MAYIILRDPPNGFAPPNALMMATVDLEWPRIERNEDIPDLATQRQATDASNIHVRTSAEYLLALYGTWQGKPLVLI